ncbi:DUF1444 family protein [Denitrobaculum tricleocarpae]|uniref:DUF1444 family protein n=1 Tax=Denitrobaculum tricleocarpae TaxID=2591009 RepID=A0A545TTF5_9PROT|nr:DUF1444 family protein [Denitrobaculum tricleocarpae]TQV80498.1 DUF1444 family protein [Denitrobaculum tricleocarpae]
MVRFVNAACVLLLLFPMVHASAADVLSEDAFAKLVLEELHSEVPDYEVRIAGRLHLTLKPPEGEAFQVYLDNAYKLYQTSPELRSDIISSYMVAWLNPGHSEVADIDVSKVVPVIKDTGYIPRLQQSVRASGADLSEWRVPAHEPYNRELVVLFAEDTDRSIRYLSEQDLVEIGFEAENRLERAIENLRGLLPDIRLYGGNGTYGLGAGGDYEASILLLANVWKSDKIAVNGELVVAVPARNTLAVTGSEDAEGLAALRRIIASTMQEEAYTLTDRLFVYRDGRFVLYE